MDKDETYIYTLEYYLAIKNYKIMSLAATWMELEIFMPSERRKRKTNIILICRN